MESDAQKSPYVHNAFISYSRKDKEFAKKLVKALEGYKPPKDLKDLPQCNLNVFRDEEDFTGVEYKQSVAKHLKDSEKLIVLCSPNSRKSEYVNEEIQQFAETRGTDNIIPVLVSGIPNNEAKPGQEEEMAFPEALCEVMDMPLAADYRSFDLKKDKVNKGVFYGSWYTILANLYDISRDEVEQREKEREAKARRVKIRIVGGVMAILLIALAITLYFWSDAVEQRNIAEEQRKEAERQKNIALARQLAAQAESKRGSSGTDLATSMLLSVESLLHSPISEGDQALRNGLILMPRSVKRLTHEGESTVSAIASNPDGRWLATASGKIVRVREVNSGQEMPQIEQEDEVTGLTLSPDAKG